MIVATEMPHTDSTESGFNNTGDKQRNHLQVTSFSTVKMDYSMAE